MERIEVNCQTGEVQIIQLTPEEVTAAEAQYATWQAEQVPTVPEVDFQAQITALTAELEAIKSKVGV
jgi:hypothetical protein